MYPKVWLLFCVKGIVETVADSKIISDVAGRSHTFFFCGDASSLKTS